MDKAIILPSTACNPPQAGKQGVLVAVPEVVEAGHFEDVGDVDLAVDNRERKSARNGERDRVLQCAFRSRDPAALRERRRALMALLRCP